MALRCKFSGDCNGERIFKIGQYLMKLYVEHLGFPFFGPPCINDMPGLGLLMVSMETCMQRLRAQFITKTMFLMLLSNY